MDKNIYILIFTLIIGLVIILYFKLPEVLLKIKLIKIKNKCKIISQNTLNNVSIIQGQKEEINKSQYKIFISICNYINKYNLEEIFNKYTYERLILIFDSYQNIFIADKKENKIKYLLELGQKIKNIDKNLIVTLNNINDIDDFFTNLTNTWDLSEKTEHKEISNILHNIMGYNSYFRTEKNEYNDYYQFDIKKFISGETRISEVEYNNLNDYLSSMIDVIESILHIHYNNYHSVYNENFIEVYNKLHSLKGKSITEIINLIKENDYKLLEDYKKITGGFNILLLLYCMHYKDSLNYNNKFNESKKLIKDTIINLSFTVEELKKYNIKLSNDQTDLLQINT